MLIILKKRNELFELGFCSSFVKRTRDELGSGGTRKPQQYSIPKAHNSSCRSRLLRRKFNGISLDYWTVALIKFYTNVFFDDLFIRSTVMSHYNTVKYIFFMFYLIWEDHGQKIFSRPKILRSEYNMGLNFAILVFFWSNISIIISSWHAKCCVAWYYRYLGIANWNSNVGHFPFLLMS